MEEDDSGSRLCALLGGEMLCRKHGTEWQLERASRRCRDGQTETTAVGWLPGEPTAPLLQGWRRRGAPRYRARQRRRTAVGGLLYGQFAEYVGLIRAHVYFILL